MDRRAIQRLRQILDSKKTVWERHPVFTFASIVGHGRPVGEVSATEGEITAWMSKWLYGDGPLKSFQKSVSEGILVKAPHDPEKWVIAPEYAQKYDGLMASRTRGAAEFDEAKHKRDDAGKFAEKEGGGGKSPAHSESRPETYGDVAAGVVGSLDRRLSKMLLRLSEKKANRLIDGHSDLTSWHEFGGYKNAAKKFGIPGIPLDGPNTHAEERDGFRHDPSKTEIRTFSANPRTSPFMRFHVDMIRDAWNALPDSVRNRVKKLELKPVRVPAMLLRRRRGGGGIEAGGWNGHFRSLTFNIPEEILSEPMAKVFYHEIAHIDWQNIEESHPGRAAAFADYVRKKGRAPTKYGQSYANAAEENRRAVKEEDRAISEGRRGPLTELEKEAREYNTNLADSIYGNEAHSDLYAYAVGVLPQDRITISDGELGEYLREFEKLHGITRGSSSNTASLRARLAAAVSKFDESKVKRDDDGKFAEKEGGPGATESAAPGPRTYGGIASQAMDMAHKHAEHLIKHYGITGFEEEMLKDGIREIGEGAAAMTSEFPDAPLEGPNTHAYKTAGFVHGDATSISAPVGKNESVVVDLNRRVVRSMWNGLPDAVRDRVRRLVVTEKSIGNNLNIQDGGAERPMVGFYDPKTHTLKIRIGEGYTAPSTAGIFTHEIGHVRWHAAPLHARRKFEADVLGDGRLDPSEAPTEYAGKYYEQANEAADSYDKFAEKNPDIVAKPAVRKMLLKGVRLRRTLAANESHSELMAIASGVRPGGTINPEAARHLAAAYGRFVESRKTQGI